MLELHKCCSDCTSGCADGNCGGGSVIVEEAAPTEAAPKAEALKRLRRIRRRKLLQLQQKPNLGFIQHV